MRKSKANVLFNENKSIKKKKKFFFSVCNKCPSILPPHHPTPNLFTIFGN